MEKGIEQLNSYGHALTITERKNLYLNGIIKIDSFDDEEFLIETNMGYLAIKGSELEIVKLDTKDGTVSIKGLIISLSYVDDLKKSKKDNNLFNKMFK